MTTRDKLVVKFLGARAATNGAFRRLDSMPLVLRLTFLASLSTGVVLLAVCVLQIGSIRVNKESLSWVEVRAAGYYPFLVISGLVMAVVAFLDL
jgi:hypothetical protein